MALVLECPWNVESLEDFLYYCCPECDEKSQSREDFLCHALAYHPSSNNYLMPLEVKQEVKEKIISTDLETDLKDPSANNFQVKEENIIQDDNDTIEDDEEYFLVNNHDNNEIYELKQETDNSDELRCDQCDKIFRSKSGLDYHLNFFHTYANILLSYHQKLTFCQLVMLKHHCLRHGWRSIHKGTINLFRCFLKG